MAQEFEKPAVPWDQEQGAANGKGDAKETHPPFNEPAQGKRRIREIRNGGHA
jgi:hypothetical protein